MPRQTTPFGTQANAGYPPLDVLQELVGWRSVSDLWNAFAAVWTRDEALPLPDALFPGQPSYVLHLCRHLHHILHNQAQLNGLCYTGLRNEYLEQGCLVS